METKNLFDKIENIHELTNEDFTTNNNKTTIHNKDIKDKYGMLLVYAPWCGHCKKSVGLFDYMANEVNDYDIKIAAVNSENKKNKQLVKELGVKSFPTIFTINKGIKNKHKMKGSLKKYGGERNINNLMIELYVMKNNL